MLFTFVMAGCSSTPAAPTPNLQASMDGEALTAQPSATPTSTQEPAPTPVPPTSAPRPATTPTNVAATAGNAQAVVTWSASSSNGGSPITGYSVTASPGGATATWSSGALTATITGLANGTAYTFTVTATTAVSTSAASSATPATIPTATLTPTVASTATATQSVPWSACDSANSPVATYSYQDGGFQFDFDINPASSRVKQVFLGTTPAMGKRHEWDANNTNGFNLHHFRRTVFEDLSATSFIVPMLSPTSVPVNVTVTLNAQLEDASWCTALLVDNFSYNQGLQGADAITIPEGVTIDYDRYSGFTVPQPLAESVIYAMSSNDPYQERPGWMDVPLRDYPAKLRVALYGVPTTTHWQIAAELIEVIRAIAPDLDARFATTHEEVTMPLHVTACPEWKIKTEEHPCNSRGMDGSFSDGGYRDGGLAETRGYLWISGSSGYTTTLIRHEMVHQMGLGHVKCKGSISIVPDYQGQYWTASDLAAIAVHQEVRTTHGMTMDQARSALGIPKDSRWEELLADRSLVCENQVAAYDALAAKLQSNSE